MSRFGLLFVFAWLTSCGPPPKAPELAVSASPARITRDGKASTITVDATDSAGKPGTGEVSIESSVGSLSTAATFPLSAGVATATITCDVAKDVGCGTDAIVISASWTSAGRKVNATVNVALVAPTGSTGGGSACVTCPNGGKVSGTGGDGLHHEATWTTNGSFCPVGYTLNGAAYAHNTLDGVYYPSADWGVSVATRVVTCN